MTITILKEESDGQGIIEVFEGSSLQTKLNIWNFLLSHVANMVYEFDSSGLEKSVEAYSKNVANEDDMYTLIGEFCNQNDLAIEEWEVVKEIV